MSHLNLNSAAFGRNSAFRFSAGGVEFKDHSKIQRQTMGWLEMTAGVITLPWGAKQRDGRFLISSSLLSFGLTQHCHCTSVLLSAESLKRRRSEPPPVNPSSFIPAPPAPPTPHPLRASGRTHLPHMPASPLSRAGLGKYQPFRGFCVGGGLQWGVVPGGRLLSHCSAASSERSGVPPSMLDWA